MALARARSIPLPIEAIKELSARLDALAQGRGGISAEETCGAAIRRAVTA